MNGALVYSASSAAEAAGSGEGGGGGGGGEGSGEGGGSGGEGGSGSDGGVDVVRVSACTTHDGRPYLAVLESAVDGAVRVLRDLARSGAII